MYKPDLYICVGNSRDTNLSINWSKGFKTKNPLIIRDPVVDYWEAPRLLSALRETLFHQLKEVFIITSNRDLVDNALPEEIVVNGLSLLNLGDDYIRFKVAFETGVQHISEILISEGLWYPR